MTLRINGQDVETGDIDDGRPERIDRLCECWLNPPWQADPTCSLCGGRGYRDETDAEYWSRVEAMTPKSKDDLL